MNAEHAQQQQETDVELDEFINFKAAISPEEMKHLEASANDDARGLQRRLCLLSYAGTAETLSALSRENPDAFTEMLDAVADFKEHTKALSELSALAYIRMLIADQREHKTDTAQPPAKREYGKLRSRAEGLQLYSRIAVDDGCRSKEEIIGFIKGWEKTRDIFVKKSVAEWEADNSKSQSRKSRRPKLKVSQG